MSKPDYLENIDQLSEEGQALVHEILLKGKQVRDAIQEMRDAAREELRPFADETELQRQSKLAEITELSNNLVCSDNVTLVVENIIQALINLKAYVMQRREDLDVQLMVPKGSDAVDAIVSEFYERMEILKDIAKSENFTLHWKIRQAAENNPDAKGEDEGMILEGGRITDVDGNNIWGADCYFCGKEVQDGAKGEGHQRRVYLESKRTIKCMDCYQISTKIYQVIEDHNDRNKIIELWENFDEHATELSVTENDVAVFIRLPVNEAVDLAHSMNNAFIVFGDRPLFGIEHENNQIEWITYSQVRYTSISIALKLRNVVKGSRFVGIIGKNEPEWLYADFACAWNEYTSVGIHTSWPVEDIIYVINNASIECVITDEESLPKILEAQKSCPDLHSVIVTKYSSGVTTGQPFLILDHLENTHQYTETISGVGLHTPVETIAENDPRDSNADNIFSLIYSSGTTGKPKGIISTVGNWRSDNLYRPNFLEPYVIVSYAALAHGMDRGMVWQCMSNGGRVGFCTDGDIFNSLQIFKPVLFVAMSYLWNNIYNKYKNALSKQGSDPDQVNSTFRNILGGRTQWIATGGSATSPEVIQFMQDMFDCLVTNAYGCTECPGISSNGIISSEVELKLRDIPERGYTNDDEPNPRGEILVKSTSMSPGYFNNPEKTAESFVDGWFHTSDIGEIDSEGVLHIIDRIKGLIELYVDGRSVWSSGGTLEAIYSECKYVKNVYVHGDRMQPYVVAVVVPSTELLDHPNQEIISMILSEFEAIANNANLETFLIPKGVHIEKEEWTIEQGLISVSNKLCRDKIKAKYELELAMVYDQLN
eukprot:TRINITY_DN8977_c0_g1_i1.p1 TRINITY_DN8977_c0_g1~~TRINITY_DN8977_c0_g1_i1.p1  ORF type:complete len:831 (-),score=189.22 TRINITY_DN8977_c0_g1_i1:22-2493(-)